jgi:two-component system, response regulator, stage 0 sporulation protein A
MKSSKINIVIADDNITFCNILKDYLSAQRDFDVIGIAYDGIDTLNIIKEYRPDLVLLDMIMPHIDGLEVLERLRSKEFGFTPRVIMFSAIGPDRLTQQSLVLGADYYLMKPLNLDILTCRIRELFNLADTTAAERAPAVFHSTAKENKETFFRNVHTEISNIVNEIGIPINACGSAYLKEAINISVSDITMLFSLTSRIYPVIAEKYNTKPCLVERAIRHAIEVAWTRNEKAQTNFHGKLGLDLPKTRPTNKELISIISDKFLLLNKENNSDS